METPGATASLSLSLDRFEGKNKSIAVLEGDDGQTINLPKEWLPAGTKAGDVLTLSLTRDDRATADLVDETRQAQKALEATDPGGDIKL